MSVSNLDIKDFQRKLAASRDRLDSANRNVESACRERTDCEVERGDLLKEAADALFTDLVAKIHSLSGNVAEHRCLASHLRVRLRDAFKTYV